MTATQVLVVAVVVWVAIGLIASLVMGRRGHDAFGWLVLGAVLGPLAVPLAVRAVRGERPRSARVVRTGSEGEGAIDVLVGIDGSDTSARALEAAVSLLGPRVGRLTLAQVVEHDAPPIRRDTETSLGLLAATLGDGVAGAVVLIGKPSEALSSYATSNDFEMLVVGRRGRGASRALLGSTATQLAHGADVPVLIV
jgi:nucleotide-binding universal stress UspA family protein